MRRFETSPGRFITAQNSQQAAAMAASQKALRAVGEIMSASSRPTMSFRNLPPEFRK